MGGVWHVKPTFGYRANGLRDKGRADRVPYDVWEREGWLAGNAWARSVDYEYVADNLAALVDKADVRKIAFDTLECGHLEPWLAKAGFEEGQLEGRHRDIRGRWGRASKSMSRALRDLERHH